MLSCLIGLASDAVGQLPFQSSQWEVSNPTSTQSLLSEITFDQYSSGAYGYAVSEDWYNYYVNPQSQPFPPYYASIYGPGIVGVGPASGFGSDQTSLFTGFADNGGPGIVTIQDTISLDGPGGYLNGLSFDVYTGELPGGLHGPTSFYVQISTDSSFSVYWQSELVQLVPGTANAIHWDITNPDGNDANGDGIAVMSALPPTTQNTNWRSLYYDVNYNRSASLEVRIVASGANSSLTGLGLDNIQITGLAPVPEPSSCLLLVLGMCLLGGRARTRRA